MIAAIDALINNRREAIMLFASSCDVVREREALSEWFDREWRAIPRRAELVKTLLADGDALAKSASTDLLAKADPAEALTATLLAHQLQAKHGNNAGFWSTIARGEEMARCLAEYNERAAELNKLEQRSDLRFAVAPSPLRHTGQHH
jgi:hypothetical protein